jgi:hypothetical protein
MQKTPQIVRAAIADPDAAQDDSLARRGLSPPSSVNAAG